MADIEELKRRVESLEDHKEQAYRYIADINRRVDSVPVLSDELHDHRTRLRDIELAQANQQMVGKVIAWIGAAITSSSIMLVLTYLFGVGK